MKFEVYTYFGRVITTFIVPENRTHHETFEQACKYMASCKKEGVKVWIRRKTSKT